jgi:N6-adenosine-specific RNA methylase IME4
MKASDDLLSTVGKKKFATVLADPPWQFQNRTGKMAPEHKRLQHYPTMSLQEIKDLPVEAIVEDTAHLYLWLPNALLAEGMQVMEHWGFTYKTNLIWYKIRKDGGPDRRGVGFYFRNVTEIILFGVRGKNARTLQPGRSQENIISSRKREHSRKPDEQYELMKHAVPGLVLNYLHEDPEKTGSFGVIRRKNILLTGIHTQTILKQLLFHFRKVSKLCSP